MPVCHTREVTVRRCSSWTVCSSVSARLSLSKSTSYINFCLSLSSCALVSITCLYFSSVSVAADDAVRDCDIKYHRHQRVIHPEIISATGNNISSSNISKSSTSCLSSLLQKKNRKTCKSLEYVISYEAFFDWLIYWVWQPEAGLQRIHTDIHTVKKTRPIHWVHSHNQVCKWRWKFESEYGMKEFL